MVISKNTCRGRYLKEGFSIVQLNPSFLVDTPFRKVSGNRQDRIAKGNKETGYCTFAEGGQTCPK
jgi:hypothetical protein